MSAFYYNLIAQGVPPHMAAKAAGIGSTPPVGYISQPQTPRVLPYSASKSLPNMGSTPSYNQGYGTSKPLPSMGGVTPSYVQGTGAPKTAGASGAKKTSSPTVSGTKATPRTGTSAPAAAAGPVQAAHLTTQVMDAPAAAAAPAAPTLSPQQQAANDYLASILGAAQQAGPIPGATPQFVGYPTMFASLSPTQLASPEVQATIAALLAEAGAPAPTGGTLPAGAVSSAMMYNPDGTFNWDLYHQALAQGLKVQ